MRMPSHQVHSFSQVPAAQIERSVFDRSCAYKTMFNSGYLIPFYREEVLPGDTFNVNTTIFVRMPSALNVPFMDSMYLDTFYFFVPNRLIWSNWVKFMGEQANPNDSTSFTVPKFTAYNPVAESLSDYLGIPPLAGGATVSHISLYHRAYNKIWNDHFRDENLQNSVTVDTGDGDDSIANYVLLKRGKRHDYFTSCLPWTQKGTAVTAPIGGLAPIKGIALEDANPNVANLTGRETGTTPNPTYTNPWTTQNKYVYFKQDGSNNPSIYADLSSASGISINQLRQSFQIQRMYERDARGGTRYIEMVKAHFGVTSPDARLQRSEFLGGRSTPINVSSVPQTSSSNAQPTPQGNLAAYAHALHQGDGFIKSFTEHGVILGLCMVRVELSYQQGLERDFSRSSRLDYYWPALAHLGEQAILSKEIYLAGSADTAGDATVFGYLPRYDEYRQKLSLITGKLRSTYTTPLDIWHGAEKFTSRPTLSAAFITSPNRGASNDPIDRLVAVVSEPQFVMDAFIKSKAVRPMPTYAVPGMIDHF